LSLQVGILLSFFSQLLAGHHAEILRFSQVVNQVHKTLTHFVELATNILLASFEAVLASVHFVLLVKFFVDGDQLLVAVVQTAILNFHIVELLAELFGLS